MSTFLYIIIYSLFPEVAVFACARPVTSETNGNIEKWEYPHRNHGIGHKLSKTSS